MSLRKLVALRLILEELGLDLTELDLRDVQNIFFLVQEDGIDLGYNFLW